MRFFKKHKGFFILLFFLLFWIGIIYHISPDRIVAAMGVETGYFLIFLTAFIGVSGFASAPFYATLLTLVSTGEFNIFFLAIIVAPARAFGDALFFLLGHKGHSVIGSRLKSFSLWLAEKPDWMTPLVAYLYTALTPLPQDILMLVLGLGRTHFKKIIVAVILGNATFVILISLIATGLIPIIF